MHDSTPLPLRNRLDYFSTECTYAPEAYRGYARVFLKDLERVRPRAIADIISAAEDMCFPVRAQVRKGARKGAIASAGIVESETEERHEAKEKKARGLKGKGRGTTSPVDCGQSGRVAEVGEAGEGSAQAAASAATAAAAAAKARDSGNAGNASAKAAVACQGSKREDTTQQGRERQTQQDRRRHKGPVKRTCEQCGWVDKRGHILKSQLLLMKHLPQCTQVYE